MKLVGGKRAHWLDSNLIRAVSEPVLQEALPLSAQLRRPALLLEGQRLQAVVKAQRIELGETNVPDKANGKSSSGDDANNEYMGLWHVDGEHEQVAAVVLFYYNVDDSLDGGNMEFIDRRPLDVLGTGDTGHPNTRQFHPHSLHEALRGDDRHQDGPAITNCSVPVKSGTLLVFSNYQMAHRVLHMVNQSTKQPASRDFVALFILDPAAHPLVPSRCHLARSYLYERTLNGTLKTNADTGILDEPVRRVRE